MIKVYVCKVGNDPQDDERFINLIKQIRKMENTKVYLVGDTCRDWNFVVDHKLDGIAVNPNLGKEH